MKKEKDRHDENILDFLMGDVHSCILKDGRNARLGLADAK